MQGLRRMSAGALLGLSQDTGQDSTVFARFLPNAVLQAPVDRRKAFIPESSCSPDPE